ncbi:MAG: hypothetical protein JXJ19_02810 [Elusimicrobia bacterium]|nr:hypothetical protein [Elusimicrobiota bacterium]
MLEISLTRIFSVVLYYHFSFMIISTALFGFGAGGVLLYLINNSLDEQRTPRYLALFSNIFAVSVFVSLFLILKLPAFPNLQGNAVFRLILYYLICALPFFSAGLCVSLAVSRFPHNIGRVYFSDLLGAGLGCITAVLVMNVLDGITAVIFVSFLAAVGTVCFTKGDGGTGKSTVKHRNIALSTAVVFAMLTAVNALTGMLRITYVKGENVAGIPALYDRWNSFSRVAVYAGNTKLPDDRKFLYSWGLSESFSGPVPGQLYMNIDNGARTVINRFDGDFEKTAYLRYDIVSFAYYLKDSPKALIIGSGGGADVLAALSFGSTDVTAVEYNPLIVKAVREDFRDFSGNIYSRPEVKVFTEEGRSFVRNTGDKFDIVQLSLVDTAAASAAGAYVLAENFLYTSEAFRDYLEVLNNDGVLTITRWMYSPPKETIRLISMGLEALEKTGAERPKDHMAVFKSRQWAAAFILKKTPFTEEDVRILEDAGGRLGFETVYLPYRYTDNDFYSLTGTADKEQFYAKHPFDISPSSDDRPFYFNNIRLKDFLKAYYYKKDMNLFNSEAILVLVAVFCTALILVLLFIFAPLLTFRKNDIGKTGASVLKKIMYFGCLGMGFMLIEISLINKFILFLGHPVYALSVVLFSILVFCGIGSYLTVKFSQAGLKKALVRVLAGIIILSLAYIMLLPVIIYSNITMPFYLKVFLSTLIIAPLGLILGMPFPIAIKMINDERNAMIIPWAWSVNSAASVMGSIITLVIAMSYGFNAAILTGSAIYTAALFLRPS